MPMVRVSNGGTSSENLLYCGLHQTYSNVETVLDTFSLNSSYFTNNNGTLTAKKAFTCNLFAYTTYQPGVSWADFRLYKNGSLVWSMNGEYANRQITTLQLNTNDTIKFTACNQNTTSDASYQVATLSIGW